MCPIRIRNLKKSYKRHCIFDHVHLDLDERMYHFLIGENGAGKSTFIKCLLDEVKYSGVIEKSSHSIAYVPEKIILPDYVTVSDYLYWMAKIQYQKNMQLKEKVFHYLQRFAMENYAETPICQLSQGTRQKVLLIQALLSESDIYIFDEPLRGLDEYSKKCFIEEIRKLKQKDKLIVISTHTLEQYRVRKKHIISFPLGEDYVSNSIT
ncbi:MAG: ABC transporter ATP-binding protein [Prevotella sp.]|nr:ABC transporter ATP-binding protein [Staphylococcus sp.]MCM1350426.1 ABC transporter ATP-binding protein [Prevotella sp.]